MIFSILNCFNLILIFFHFPLFSLCNLESWKKPICEEINGNEICLTELNVEITQDCDHLFFFEKFESFESESQEYFLDESILITIQRIPSLVFWPLSFSQTFFNVYENFEYDESCPLSFDIGSCSEISNQPPTENGDEKYVLCCLDSPRGYGKHCLQYDYNSRFDSYSFSNPTLTEFVNISIQKGNQSFQFQLTQFDYSKSLPNQYSANLSITNISDHHQQFQNISKNYWFFNEYFSVGNKSLNFFLIPSSDPNISKLNLPASIFKNQASCKDSLYSLTKTHEGGDPKNQFEVYSQFTIPIFIEQIQQKIPNLGTDFDIFFSQKTGEISAAILQIDYSKNPDLTTINLSIQNISVH
ncbi:hypothetical protein M0811_02030 [Anaeramoeba ignava]|uniref:Transmembrane protein n=1 Tax=Anaeramoeba ignava TaxID=1746090 RepID=A0A9Q0LGH2_ANAIG|nr:hypothetical protein M0811_02030 [Anaeramoeba ignava]